MNTTATSNTQSIFDAILRANSKLQRANDALQKEVVALKRLSALRADQVEMADKERDTAIKARVKMEGEMLQLQQRAETAEASSARLEQQLVQATQDQPKVQRESEVQLVLQDAQDCGAEATAGANKAPEEQKTLAKEDAAPCTTSTTPRKKTTTDQAERARVIASAKNAATKMGAGPTAGSRARVRPATSARARVGATASTVCTRARVEATAAARALIAATAGNGASRMPSAKPQTRVKTEGRRIAQGNGC